MNDLISVIVPAYNVEKEITRCLDSIAAQTYQNIEILAVDDGSSDATAEILDRYSETHKNVRVIHKENRGVTSARLCGVREARGEWIGFVDGDDEIEPDMYERLLKNALEYNAQISHCGYQMRFSDGRIHYFHNTGILVQQDQMTALRELLSGGMFEPGLWNKLFHKRLLQDLLRTDKMDTGIKINEDLLMNFYLFREAERTVFEDFCPYHYIIRAASATRRGLTEHDLWDPVRVREIILQQVPEELAETAQCAYLGACISACNRIAREKNRKYNGDFRNARRRIWERRSWLNLLSKKSLVYALLILCLPGLYGPVYRFYFNNISRKPYD